MLPISGLIPGMIATTPYAWESQVVYSVVPTCVLVSKQGFSCMIINQLTGSLPQYCIFWRSPHHKYSMVITDLNIYSMS